MKQIRPVWAEVDLDCIKHNMKEIKKISGDKKIVAVVKADAYGHGAIDVAPILLENGATSLAVAVITEAMELIAEGITAPIMILGYTPLAFSKELIENCIEQTVYDLDYAKKLSEEAIKLNKKAKVHIALDTGMGRIGFIPDDDGFKKVLEICKLEGLDVVGIFTHFASSDEIDKSYTKNQFMKFINFYKMLEEAKVTIPIKHVANSAAIIDLQEMHQEAIRPGIILYGYYPSEEVIKERLDLKPALTLKTNIVHIKTMDEGMYISYGRTFKTERKSVIATLPIGYADGYTRLLTNKAKVIINGKLVPVVGRICMDQCMIDVTDIENIKLGDEVILLGEQGNVKFNADNIAELIGTINYEVICMIKTRVPRIYIKDGKVIKIRNYV